jgi:AcrR family transcriptional regulator
MPESSAAHPGSIGRSPRRAPSPEERQRDSERSRQRILDAAVEEFATKGFAGARVAEIAAHAGVNAQLIAYYFGGKQGLYDTLRRQWESEEAVFAAPEHPFSAVIDAFLAKVCDHPSWARLLIWQALGDGSVGETQSLQKTNVAKALENIRQRQDSGELTREFEPETILVVLWSAVMAPVTLPQIIQEAYGTQRDAAFRSRYASQLKRLFLGTRAPSSTNNVG